MPAARHQPSRVHWHGGQQHFRRQSSIAKLAGWRRIYTTPNHASEPRQRSLVLMPEGDAPLGQVVRRDLACHQVAHLYGSGRVGWPRWASVRLSCCRPWHEAVRHANRVTRPLLHRRPGTSGEGPATKGRRRGAGGKGRRVTHREPPHGTLASSKGTGLPACAQEPSQQASGPES